MRDCDQAINQCGERVLYVTDRGRTPGASAAQKMFRFRSGSSRSRSRSRSLGSSSCNSDNNKKWRPTMMIL